MFFVEIVIEEADLDEIETFEVGKAVDEGGKQSL